MKARVICFLLALCMTMSLLACGGKKGNDTGNGSGNKQTQAQMSWQEQYELGIRLLNEGKYEDAILAFQAAIQIDPKNVDAYLSLAEVHMQMGNANKAQSVLQDGVDRCGEDSYDIFISIATKYEIVLNVGGQEMTEETLTWDEYIEKGDQLIADGDYDAAIRAYEDAIAQEEDEPEPYLGMAEAYVQMGNVEKAIEVLQQGYDACWSESDQNKILEYAKELGYVLDDSGKLVKFDEEAYLASATVYEKLDYYMNKGSNKDHWCFGDTFEINGMRTFDMSLDDVMATSAQLGWGEMTKEEGYSGDRDAVETKHSGAYRSFAGAWRYMDSTKPYFGILWIGACVDLGMQGLNQNVYDGFAAKPATGIYDIHIGDSLENVLTALGWEYANEIGALIRNSDVEPIGEYNQWHRRVDGGYWSDLEMGAKQYEQFKINRTNWNEKYVTLECHIMYKGEDVNFGEAVIVEFSFAPFEDYALYCVTVSQYND